MVACVLINTSVKKLNRVYDYLVKDEDIDKAKVGKRVKVSFGKGKNSYAEGIIVKIYGKDYKSEYKLKNIDEILDEVSYIDESKLKLAKWMSYMYFCNVYDVLKLMLPPGTNNIDSNKSLKPKQDTIVKLAKSEDEIEADISNKIIKAPKQILILRFLESLKEESITIKNLLEGLNTSRAVLNKLVDSGYVTLEKIDVQDEYTSYDNIKRDIKQAPTDEQKYAIDKINSYITSGQNKKILLFGVTGSRKNRSLPSVYRKGFRRRKKCYSSCSRNFTYKPNY